MIDIALLAQISFVPLAFLATGILVAVIAARQDRASAIRRPR